MKTAWLFPTTIGLGAGLGTLAQTAQIPETPTTVMGLMLGTFAAMVAGFIWLIKVYYPDQQKKADERLDKTQQSFRDELKEFRLDARETRALFKEEIKLEREMCRDELQAIGRALTDIHGRLSIKTDSVTIQPREKPHGDDPGS